MPKTAHPATNTTLSDLSVLPPPPSQQTFANRPSSPRPSFPASRDPPRVSASNTAAPRHSRHRQCPPSHPSSSLPIQDTLSPPQTPRPRHSSQETHYTLRPPRTQSSISGSPFPNTSANTHCPRDTQSVRHSRPNDPTQTPTHRRPHYRAPPSPSTNNPSRSHSKSRKSSPIRPTARPETKCRHFRASPQCPSSHSDTNSLQCKKRPSGSPSPPRRSSLGCDTTMTRIAGDPPTIRCVRRNSRATPRI